MHLLVPTEFLRPELEKLGGIDIENDKAVEKLARKFRVSTQVMTIRIAQVLAV
jgi:Zn-dependent peptidase ImmA (M78 family)